MDNFGFGMKYLKYITGKKVAFAAAHYEPSIVFYDTMQSYFLKKLDAVIPFSNAYNKILSRLQVPLEKLHTIPWGVDTNTFEVVSDKKREDLRKRFGLKKDAFIVLWTGPIQQIQEPDYYKSVSCARQAIQNDPDIEFIFCFKPEGYREKYQNDSGPQLTVLNGHSDFGNLLGCVDLLFSPIHKLDSTVSPPLTWVEAMSRGVPLITTQVLGADEIIDNNVNGFITNNYDTLVSDLERIKADGISNEVRSRAREKINANYNIELIARKYLEIFTNKIGCQEP